MMGKASSHENEWLEADGLGGFASGTSALVRTRRYHALLLAATRPPTGRMALVNGFEATAQTMTGSFPLSAQAYAGGFNEPRDGGHLVEFAAAPWPTWTFELPDRTRIAFELFVPRGHPAVALRWRRLAGTGPVRLVVRPLLSGRDHHALHHENGAFRFDATTREASVTWRPYDGVPGVVAASNGRYRHEPLWYRRFEYSEELVRGLDGVEDLASPGELEFALDREAAVLLLAAELAEGSELLHREPPVALHARLAQLERERRAAFASPLHRAGDAYLVNRGAGKTIVAGYPWFTDWGRDTFIAMRGLCLATGRLDEARAILLEWSGQVSEGMLPNYFPDQGSAEFNSVDASLWYVIAVFELLEALAAAGRRIATKEKAALVDAVDAILTGYSAGTRHGIRADTDGLLAAGEPGVQLTWMDARVDGWVVTPRIGKPVEVQALWANALWAGSQLSRDHGDRWGEMFERVLAEFSRRFWNEAAGGLYDVVEVDHQPGALDASIRPNQIFAAGGLPVSLLDAERSRRVVDLLEARLWTPMGLRSLAPDDPAFRPRCVGPPLERDGAYHQGTVWPWLTGAFVEAFVRAHGSTPAARREARARFVNPLLRHLDSAGLGHVSEIADGASPHTPRGCPFQAWSMGELLRLELQVLAKERGPKNRGAGGALIQA